MQLLTLTNPNNFKATFTNYGARLVSLFTPDLHQNFEDIVLGFDNLDNYLTAKNKYFGATVGRYCNRIGGASFEIEGKKYNLTANESKNHLHGGGVGNLTEKMWDFRQISEQEVAFYCVSDDGEEGFPGILKTKVLYTLTNNNELKIEYFATTTHTTHINLTHHSYFNLSGDCKTNVHNHKLKINAHFYTPVNFQLIPTGEIISIKNTPLDFTKTKMIGEQINHPFLKNTRGYDHNFVLKKRESSELSLGAVVTDEVSGRKMEVWTTEPGMQLYTANHLNQKNGKKGKHYQNYDAFCLEPQHFPNSPNIPHFPNTILYPHNIFRSTTIFKFQNLPK